MLCWSHILHCWKSHVVAQTIMCWTDKCCPVSYLKYLGLYYIYLLALENGYHIIGKIGIGYILLLEFGQYAFPLIPLAP